MGHWLASERRGQIEGTVSRFDPALWTVDFPRPMMASVTTTAPDALRVDAVFYRADQIGGLIWEAEDRHDHPLLAYETSRDFRGCRLSFRWRSVGLLRLDAVATGFLLSPADRAASVTITLRQIGTYGLSPPAILTLPAIGEA